MGVKELWSIISPLCSKKSLWELEGKTIAIDLSAWVCDSQFMGAQPNTYLRNIFFRTVYLLLLGVKPIFVLEGSAPTIKSNTIRQRLKGSDKDNVKEGKVVRSRLASHQKQCVEMLSSMGISCVKAPGEAEEFCAHLNKKGIVCGVVTQDSDVFLYGATEVYRNFQMAPGYTCDVYRLNTIEEKLGLSRVKMVALSLLTGCDYTSGVHRVGKESAIKYLKTVPDDQVFKRFEEWHKESTFSLLERQKYITSNMQLEIMIREKAMKGEGFPHMEVIEEFMKEPEDIVLDLTWKQPDIAKFVSFAVRKLLWDDEYSIKKFLPILTRWHLEHNGENCCTWMTSIQKSRTLRGNLFYEVTWDSYQETTTEPKHLVDKVYPDLVSSYEGLKKKKPKSMGVKKPRANKAKQAVKEVNCLDTLDKFVSKVSLEGIEIEDTSELDLSSIINNIVSRPISNPALEHYQPAKI